MARDYRYNTLVNIEPFIMHKFPQEEERFSIIVVSKHGDNVTRNLVQYLTNSFHNEIVISATDDLSNIEKKFSDKYTHGDELKRQFAIIDISGDGRFKNLQIETSSGSMTNIVSYINPDTPDWLKTQQIKNIINPNMIVQYVEGCENNFSHTIWLTDSPQNLPEVLTTNSHYLFILDHDNVTDFMKKRYKNDFTPQDKDEIIVIGMTISKDMEIFTLDKSKFT